MKRILLLVALLLTLATPAQAAIALVTEGCWGSTDGNTFTTGTKDTSGANFIAVLHVSFESATEPTLSDSKSNGAGTARTVQALSGSARVRWRYYTNPTVGTLHTWTSTGASTFSAICMKAFSGVDTTSPFDVEAAGATFSVASTWQAGTLTPSANNYVVLSGSGFGGTSPTTLGSGFTYTAVSGTDLIANTGGACFGAAVGYEIQTSATARDPQWANGGGNSSGGVVNASFKVAAGGGATATPRLMLMGLP